MSAPAPLLVARHAMATRFEFALHGDDAAALRAAGEEALDVVERIDNQLSLYRPHTDIARVNARAANEPVHVAPEVFRLLQRAFALTAATEGAFDITAAPLVKAWGFVGGGGSRPEPAALAEARACVGPQHVLLDEASFTVHFTRPGVMLDLGSLGKGYALERAAELLREAGITRALLHGGTSTVVAIGAPPDAESWKIALPQGESVPLRDESLSVSATWGKSFREGGQTYGHVLDPRSGEPVTGERMAAVALPSATESDAFSTSLLVLGETDFQHRVRSGSELRTWFSTRTDGG
ncbi:MAG TPA: FAD:protein FMN transferase [Candidatus Limnocylindria bacterium]|nr:FAD:protein FMN transferase [Candidatus Limnocylindria bacterium]